MWNLLLRGSSKILPPNLEKTSECSHHSESNFIVFSSLPPSAALLNSISIDSPPTFSFILFIYIYPLLSPLLFSTALYFFLLFPFLFFHCKLQIIENMRLLKVATCNLNQWAMDFDCNMKNIKDSISRAKEAGAVIRLGPELEITGYGCEDHFLELDTISHA